MSIIHWNRPGPGEYGHDHPNDLRISSYQWGDVESITALLTSRIRSHGHDVESAGGNYTGEGGRPIALWFNVAVTLDGRDPMIWEHGVCEASEDWLRPTHKTDDQGDNA